MEIVKRLHRLYGGLNVFGKDDANAIRMFYLR
ncbi:MAG: hypothetical protein FMNOHCHN_00853 [Ignavibacteriaceae bacterium]|nr:hypothetical protein [Ignavibacteriaceae bacterium]